VDSKKLQKSFAAKQDNRSKDGGGNKQKCLTVVDLVAKKRQDDKEYDRRLNIIEVIIVSNYRL